MFIDNVPNIIESWNSETVYSPLNLLTLEP